jgi:hypothetical protein
VTRLSDFTDAPLGAYVCEEGWLVVGDEAWTFEEWLYAEECRNYAFRRPKSTTNGRPRIYPTLQARRHAEYLRHKARRAAVA